MPYVLVADTDADRTAACLELLNAHGATVRTATSAAAAAALVNSQGAPSLLILDLALPGGGLAVVDALPAGRRDQTSIVAWAADEGMREFARQRLAGFDARVLGAAVRFRVLEALLERLLRRAPAAGPAEEPPASAAATGDALTELSHKARQLSPTAGVAVYLRAPGETKFRASVSWTSEAPIPNVPTWMPKVFGAVLETTRPLVLPDLSSEPASNLSVLASQDGISGIVAVPVTAGAGEIAGMICLFDVEPFTLSTGQIDALRVLGGGSPRPGPAPVPVRVPDHDEGATDASTSELPTTMLDRRGGATAIQRELARARREQRQLSVVLFDVDPLPSPSVTVDGSHRRMIITACQALTRAIRESDLAIRWGQEELLVVLPGLGVGEARQVAERVRAAMQAGAIDAAVAGGVAELLPNEPFESVVVRANAKVRLARERGHNRVA